MRLSSPKLLRGLVGLLAGLTLVACLFVTLWVAGVYTLDRMRQIQETGASQATVEFDQDIPTSTSPGFSDTIQQATALPTSQATSPLPAKPGLAELNSSMDESLQSAQETLDTLKEANVPASDLFDLASRLKGLSPIYNSVTGVSQPGDQQNFWVMDVDANRNFQVSASLAYVTDSLYFWVEDGVNYNQRSLEKLVDAFEHKIIPTNRQFFGQEPNPGIDGDARLHILLASGIGDSIAGYFSSADEYPPQINQYSNAREMFILNADTIRLDSSFTYSTLAHEFQHMIHWNQDRNEETWLNEGFSELASILNGYDSSGHENVFILNPDIQLNDWPVEPDPAHYGAAFLFLTYFLDRFGENAAQALAVSPANGLTGVDQVLAAANPQAESGAAGQPLSAEDVFIDWAVANYLQDRRVSDGRYSYHNYPDAPQAGATEVIKDCPTGLETRQVHQYGVDYIRIRCQGDYVLRFSSASLVGLLPADAHSGEKFFWSNYGDESNSTLTRAFDFRNLSGLLTLNYWTWYDIENGFDHVYLLASEDGGRRWQILQTPSGSLLDRSGNSFGWAYTGLSGGGSQPGWIQEQVDLSGLAGKQILLRFEYVTDGSANGPGFLLDDLAIPEIGYMEDFETDDAGWDAQGFVRVQNTLPQDFRLALIETAASGLGGSGTRVTTFKTTGGQPLEISFQIGDQVNEVILVVAGTTRITRQEAVYNFQLISAGEIIPAEE